MLCTTAIASLLASPPFLNFCLCTVLLDNLHSSFDCCILSIPPNRTILMSSIVIRKKNSALLWTFNIKLFIASVVGVAGSDDLFLGMKRSSLKVYPCDG